MSRVDYTPRQYSANDLNTSSSFSTKKVTDISKFGTIKNLSAYKTDAQGNLWKLGMLSKLSRAISDAFSSNQSITARNEKTALAIVNLRKNEFSQTGDMKHKAKMLKNAIEVAANHFNAQAKNLGFSQTTRQLVKNYLSDTFNKSDELIKENSYLKVVDQANKFLNMYNDKNEISSFQLLSAILHKGVNSAEKGLQIPLSKDNFYDLKKDFIVFTDKTLKHEDIASDEGYSSLIQLSFTLDQIVEGYGAKNGEKIMQAFANLSSQICQAISSKDAAGIDAFVQRERFLLAVEKSTFCSPNQKNDIRAFMHDPNFIEEHQKGNDAMSLINKVLNFYPKPDYYAMDNFLIETFNTKFAFQNDELSNEKLNAKDGLPELIFNSSKDVDDYIMSIIKDNQKTVAALNDKRFLDALDNFKNGRSTTDELKASTAKEDKSLQEVETKTLLLKDHNAEKIQLFVDYLLGDSGLHALSLNMLKYQGLHGLEEQISMNLITACSPGAISVTKNHNGFNINCSDIITLQSFMNKGGEAPKKLASLMINHSVQVMQNAYFATDNDNDFIPNILQKTTITTIPVED